MKIGLIIIDAQKDFVEGGKLAVTGGNAAMDRVAAMIDKYGSKIDSIDLTLDAHHQFHIAHKHVFVDSNGKHPNDYTSIFIDDVCGKNPKWFGINPIWQKEIEDYLHALELRNTERRKYNIPEIIHTIWPDHCLIMTDGMSIINNVSNSVMNWELTRTKIANKTTKGSWLFREHFSVFKAEAPDPREASTMVNMPLIQRLDKVDKLVWTGLAEDYCLANSFYDFIIELSGGNESTMKDIAKKMVFLEDGTAAVGVVPQFRTMLHDFMNKYDVEISTTEKYFK